MPTQGAMISRLIRAAPAAVSAWSAARALPGPERGLTGGRSPTQPSAGQSRPRSRRRERKGIAGLMGPRYSRRQKLLERVTAAAAAAAPAPAPAAALSLSLSFSESLSPSLFLRVSLCFSLALSLSLSRSLSSLSVCLDLFLTHSLSLGPMLSTLIRHQTSSNVGRRR